MESPEQDGYSARCTLRHNPRWQGPCRRGEYLPAAPSYPLLHPVQARSYKVHWNGMLHWYHWIPGSGEWNLGFAEGWWFSTWQVSHRNRCTIHVSVCRQGKFWWWYQWGSFRGCQGICMRLFWRDKWTSNYAASVWTHCCLHLQISRSCCPPENYKYTQILQNTDELQWQELSGSNEEWSWPKEDALWIRWYGLDRHWWTRKISDGYQVTDKAWAVENSEWLYNEGDLL